MTDYVCPGCGEHVFEQQQPAVVRAEICFYTTSNGLAHSVVQSEEVEATERDGEIVCRDCGFEVEDDGTNLVTRDQFNESENDAANW